MPLNLTQSCHDGHVSQPANDTASLPVELIAEIAECGFYPDLVTETARMGVGAQTVLDHLVQHEATFAGHELHRHLTVLLRTESQLVICHVDEGESGRPEAMSTVECVALRAIDSVVVTRSLTDPEKATSLNEAWLTIVWGAAHRLDLGPAACDDPTCEADHGYAGVMAPDDITVRMSSQADGDNARRLVAFGLRLQGSVG